MSPRWYGGEVCRHTTPDNDDGDDDDDDDDDDDGDDDEGDCLP